MFWRRKNNPDTPAAAPTQGSAAPAAPAPKPGTLHTLKERQRNPAPRLPPMPPRVRPPRSRSAKHPMIVAANAVFTILALLAIGGGAAVWYGKYQLDAPGPLAQDRVVNIPRSGFRDVADVLEREGVIAQPWVFIAAVGLQKMRGVDLKSGEYQFAKQSSVQDVINTIVEGKVVQHQLTIPEGLTSEQIVQRLLDIDILSGNIREIPREGSLLPESYRFTRGTPREQVIRRMQEAQRKAVQEAWDRRAPDLPLKSPEELVTLASIVEKETGKADERPRVAAVFANRLKQRIRLQSDPTIIYGLVGGKGTLGRPIQRGEITKPTPYNTYTIPGLPPGPIANPGRAAIEATANPAKTRELFFVADGTGGHAFSETLSEHQKNVGKLRAIERQPANDAADVDDVAAQETAGAPAAEQATRPKPAPTARPAARPAAPASAQAAPSASPAQAPQRSRTQ